jgi:hypothetical protein
MRVQAYWLAVGILILIILSSISFCAETVQAVQDNAFSIEYAPGGGAGRERAAAWSLHWPHCHEGEEARKERKERESGAREAKVAWAPCMARAVFSCTWVPH